MMLRKKKQVPVAAATWGLASKKGWVEIDREYLLRLTWVPCPPFFAAGETRESWAAESAQLWFESSKSPYGRREVEFLAKMFDAIHKDVYGAGHCHQAVIHLPDPHLLPLPVQIGVWAMDGNRDETLRVLVHADGPEAIEPPIVEEFTTERLGTGLKAMHYRRSRDGKQVHGYLNYAWRSEQYETDLRVFTFSNDLGRLERAKPDLDDLVRAIEIVPRRW
jgi:hypothetical protein